MGVAGSCVESAEAVVIGIGAETGLAAGDGAWRDVCVSADVTRTGVDTAAEGLTEETLLAAAAAAACSFCFLASSNLLTSMAFSSGERSLMLMGVECLFA